MPPLVTVVVTTYNQALYIAPALESVFRQTYPAHQVVVIDDGSTDDTPQRVAPYLDRVLYVRQPNQGVAAARNEGIRRVTGDLVAFLDGDDLWQPEKLDLQVSAALRNPGAGLIVADGVYFEGEKVLRSTLIGPSIGSRLHGDEPVTLPCYAHLLRSNFIATTSQVMIPKHVLDSVGVSDTRFHLASDWDLYIRIAAKFEVAFVPQKLTRWRYLPSSVSGPHELRGLRWALDSVAVLKAHLRRAPPGHRQLIRNCLRAKVHGAAEAAYYHGRRHNRLWARQCLLRLFLDSALSPRVGLYLLALSLPPNVVRTARRFLVRPRT